MLNHGKCHGVGAFGEVLNSGEHHDAVALCNIQEAVRRVAQAVGGVELDAGAEVFHGVSNVVHIAVVGEIDVLLTGADPDCGRIAAHSDGAGIGDDGEQVNLEAVRQLNVGQHLLQVVRIHTTLGNALRWWGVGLLESAEFLQVGVIGKTNSGHHGERRSDSDCGCTAFEHSSKSTIHVYSKRISPGSQICGPFPKVLNPRVNHHAETLGGTVKRRMWGFDP